MALHGSSIAAVSGQSAGISSYRPTIVVLANGIPPPVGIGFDGALQTGKGIVLSIVFVHFAPWTFRSDDHDVMLCFCAEVTHTRSSDHRGFLFWFSRLTQ